MSDYCLCGRVNSDLLLLSFIFVGDRHHHHHHFVLPPPPGGNWETPFACSERGKINWGEIRTPPPLVCQTHPNFPEVQKKGKLHNKLFRDAFSRKGGEKNKPLLSKESGRARGKIITLALSPHLRNRPEKKQNSKEVLGQSGAWPGLSDTFAERLGPLWYEGKRGGRKGK